MNDIADRFERRFGASSGSGLGAIGMLDTGLRPKRCGDALREEKTAAMNVAMARLKSKRVRMIAENASGPCQTAPASQALESGAVPPITMEEFLAQIEQRTREAIERGLAHALDARDVSMYEAMNELLEKRRTMPPTPRGQRVR